MNVHEAWAAVMGDVHAVGKTGHNTQQNYSFRGIDAVVNAVGPALRLHGVAVVPTAVESSTRDIVVGKYDTKMREVSVLVSFTVYGPDGDSFAGMAPGEAMDAGDKATPKAMSVALRTFLLEALMIPTDEPDPDESSYELRPEPAPRWVTLTARVKELGDTERAMLSDMKEANGWPAKPADYSPSELDELAAALTELEGGDDV